MAKQHVQLWHKKQGRETGVNALARRSSISAGKPVGPEAKLSPAQAFMKKLKQEIKKTV